MTQPTFYNAIGHFFLRELFFETTNADKTNVVYTLKKRDHTYNGITYKSLYLLYMQENDPTEYRFATKYLANWDHWLRLQECPWFKEHLESWRNELEVRMKSQALAKIMAESKAGGKEAFSASKYLLEKGWEPKNTKGRPSKEDIKAAAKDQLESLQRVTNDAERLGIKLVQ